MRKSVIAGIFAYALFFVVPKASAESVAPEYLYSVTKASIKPALTAVNEAQGPLLVVTDTSGSKQIVSDISTTSVPVTAQEEYIVQQGDTLIKIANNYQVVWQRIFYKNSSIVDPDAIRPGDVIVIPTADEQLTEREIPTSVAAAKPSVAKASAVSNSAQSLQASAPSARGSSDGNRYTYGYCTWYVKNMRSDLPNNLGDAINWVARARAQGLPTGATPQAGAVGQSGNHVVYVESVNNDGTVTISEMNHVGWNIMSRRTLPASYFSYIY